MLICVVSVIPAHFLFVSSSLFFSSISCDQGRHVYMRNIVCPIRMWHRTNTVPFLFGTYMCIYDAGDDDGLSTIQLQHPIYFQLPFCCSHGMHGTQTQPGPSLHNVVDRMHIPCPPPPPNSITHLGHYWCRDLYICMHVQWTHILIDQCAVVKLPLHWLP